MYKKLLSCLLFIVPVFCLGQQSFFHFVKPSIYAYSDQMWLYKSDWPSALQLPAKFTSQNFDSLEAFIPKDGRLFGPSGGNGFRLSLQRTLPMFKNERRSLRWSVGLGYHGFRLQSHSYSFFPHLVDTTKTYRSEGEQFELRQNYLDVYNAVAYEIQSKTGHNFSLSVGISFQCSVPLASKINETYSTQSIQWNAAQRRWQESIMMGNTVSLPGRKNMILSFGLPVELGIRCSKNNTVSLGVEYSQRYRLSSFNPDRSRTNGVAFSFSFIHALH